MSSTPNNIVLPTRRLDPDLVALLRSLKAGDGVRVNKPVRIGSRNWTARTDGTFTGVAYLSTGITTERVKEDDLVVPVVRLIKKNGELTSITIDEETQLQRLE